MEDFKVRIPNTNFILEANKTYRIIGKEDPSAPDGFRRRGITKMEHPLNGENAIVSFDPNRKLWDTGLYPESPTYTKEPKLAVENVEIFKKYLIPSLEMTFPDGAFSAKSDNRYWDDYSYPLNQNLTVATNTPEAFFGLWISLISYSVAPEELKDYPIYREMSTPYLIVDRQEKSSTEQRFKFDKSKAIGYFVTNLNDTNKKHIIDVLNYVGFRASLNTEDSILNSQFTNWLDNKQDSLKNAKVFNEAFEKFSSEKGREELATYKELQKGLKNKKVRYERSEYFLGEISLGANLKMAAEAINNDDELKEKLFNLKKNED